MSEEKNATGGEGAGGEFSEAFGPEEVSTSEVINREILPGITREGGAKAFLSYVTEDFWSRGKKDGATPGMTVIIHSKESAFVHHYGFPEDIQSAAIALAEMLERIESESNGSPAPGSKELN